jgi:hypothetical protein
VTREDAKRLLERFALAEKSMQDLAFVAPVMPDGAVVVRVSGLISRHKVHPRDHEGWAVLQIDGADAVVMRPATLSEVARYLSRLPKYRMILVAREARGWVGSRATGDGRLDPERLYPIGLVTEGEPFDVACVRFDGGGFWFEELDPGRDPGAGAYLRASLGEGRPAEALERAGLSAEERRAYAHVQAEERRRAAEREARLAEARTVTSERRAARALSHAGARLVRTSATGDDMWVDFEVDGTTHRALVRGRDLTVVSAGICLSGMDADFDLASLVSVMRESGETDHG